MNKYIFTTGRWEKLFILGSGQITYGLELENPNFDPKSGRMQKWKINDITFRNNPEEFLEKVEVSESKYDELLVELNALMVKG